jgi:Immunity protein 35
VKLHLEEARALAIDALNLVQDRIGVPVEIIENDTIGIVSGWIFFWNSTEFIKTGHFSSTLAGNGPIFVDVKKTVHFLPSHQTWKDSLEQMGVRAE